MSDRNEVRAANRSLVGAALLCVGVAVTFAIVAVMSVGEGLYAWVERLVVGEPKEVGR